MDDVLVFMIDHYDWPNGQPERAQGEWIAMKPDGSWVQFETERAALDFQRGWRKQIAMIERDELTNKIWE